ncbi:MAG: hypothetical protein D0528_01050 [Methylococcales bacterium]|nr:MAG: hypothetical protein D0528_01050 [Methylococcales bacterium]
MDSYSKLVFTVIAVSLAIIAAKMLEPKAAYAGPFSAGPTIGDFIDLREIHDPVKLSEARSKLMRGIPLVRVQGGQISADVE